MNGVQGQLKGLAVLVALFLLAATANAAAGYRGGPEANTDAAIEDLRNLADDTQSCLYVLGGQAVRLVAGAERRELVQRADANLARAIELVENPRLAVSEQFRDRCRTRFEATRFHVAMQEYDSGRFELLNLMDELKSGVTAVEAPVRCAMPRSSRRVGRAARGRMAEIPAVKGPVASSLAG